MFIVAGISEKIGKIIVHDSSSTRQGNETIGFFLHLARDKVWAALGVALVG